MITFDSYLSVTPRYSKVAILTNDSLKPLYADKLQGELLKRGFVTHLFSTPPGEAFKTRARKEKLEDMMLAKGLGRDTCVIGLGGGVITDLAGFVASTYCRGVPLILIPTTLLAMVDASIGGKNGVNTPAGKNLIGTFYRPEQILMDLSLLSTLPEKEILCGKAEMIKHALIADADYLDEIELSEKSIRKSIAIKQQIVAADEKEQGKRRLLNFGHTIGHAVEMHLKISHGEAVAVGIAVESILSNNLRHLSQKSLDRILHSLSAYPHHALTYEALDPFLRKDKKGTNQEPRFVLLQDIGFPLTFDGDYCSAVKDTDIKEALACYASLSSVPRWI